MPTGNAPNTNKVQAATSKASTKPKTGATRSPSNSGPSSAGSQHKSTKSNKPKAGATTATTQSKQATQSQVGTKKDNGPARKNQEPRDRPDKGDEDTENAREPSQQGERKKSRESSKSSQIGDRTESPGGEDGSKSQGKGDQTPDNDDSRASTQDKPRDSSRSALEKPLSKRTMQKWIREAGFDSALFLEGPPMKSRTQRGKSPNRDADEGTDVEKFMQELRDAPSDQIVGIALRAAEQRSPEESRALMQAMSEHYVGRGRDELAKLETTAAGDIKELENRLAKDREDTIQELKIKVKIADKKCAWLGKSIHISTFRNKHLDYLSVAKKEQLDEGIRKVYELRRLDPELVPRAEKERKLKSAEAVANKYRDELRQIHKDQQQRKREFANLEGAMQKAQERKIAADNELNDAVSAAVNKRRQERVARQ